MQVLISAQTKGLNTALSQSTSALKTFEGAISKTNTLLTSFGIGLGAATVAKIAGDIINVTAQFEKFSAVLANTLGSDSAAQAALDEIRVFAQETPFEVSEITAAYVRWANQGLNPTIDKMTKLGDVASSLGAGFEQTAEAFKDLLVGQTKRIEEIGISAQQSNGKIQLSFKGVNLEIEKSVEGVTKALETYSQLNGVLGTSDQVSETLGGRISNLKDAYSNLLLTIGTGNGGALKDTVNILIQITNAATKVVGAFTNTDTAFGKFIASVIHNQLVPAKFLLLLINGADETNKKLKEQEERLKAITATADAAFDSGNIEAYIKALDQNIFKEEIITEIRRRQAAQVTSENAATELKIVTLDKLQAKLKELNDDFEKTDETDKKKLANIGKEIIGINVQIDALERLRKKQKQVTDEKLSSFGQKTEEDALLGSGRGKEEIARLSQFNTPLTGEDFLADVELPFEDPDRIKAAMENLEIYTKAIQDAGVGAIESLEQELIIRDKLIEKDKERAKTAEEVGAIIGDSVGDILSGQKTLVEGIKQATVKIVALFLARALAAAIDKSMETAKNPIVGLVLAAATSAAVAAMFSRIGGGGKSVGGGSASMATQNVSRREPVTSQAESIAQFEFVLHGDDLVASQTTQMNRNLRLGR